MKYFSKITTMQINNKKTLAIFLGNENDQPDSTQSEPGCTWATEGLYLGFMVGPSAATSTWDAPIKK